MTPERCPDCHHQIVWATTGKRSPFRPTAFDADPTHNGTHRIHKNRARRVVAVYVPLRDLQPGELLYRSHLGTCLNARRAG